MNKIILGIIFYGILIASIMWIHPFSTNALLLNNIIYSSFSLIATITGISAIRTIGLGDRTKSLLLILTGIGAWFIADFLWGIELIVRKEITYPAIGDYLYFLGYCALLFGLIKELRLAKVSLHTINKRILSFVIIVALLAISGFAYFSIFLSYSPDASILENIVTMGYGTGDIVLIIVCFFLFLLIWEYRGGKLSRIWLLLLLAFILDVLADSMYAYFTADYEANVNPVTNIINFVYNGGYILMAIYFLRLREFIKTVQLNATPKE